MQAQEPTTISPTTASPDGEAAASRAQDVLRIDIESDPTLGFASIQNAVPVIRSLRVTNTGEQVLEHVELLVDCNPRFAASVKLRFDKLGPGETRTISPLDLQAEHTYLSNLTEAVTASISVTAQAQGIVLGTSTNKVEVLAYDQWAGTRALPELLAAFSMPNNPAVDRLQSKASAILHKADPHLAMDGYQSKSREVVWKQVSAIYSALSAEGLHYAEPPASFGTSGQKIRTPDRILDSHVATCLDLAMLFASCFEQAGLRSGVLFKEGHAWVGVWLHPVNFPNPLTDDVQAVRKRVDSGEFLVFETTGIARHETYRPSLRIAMEQGNAHLQEEESFRYAVDVYRARQVQIKSLPSRVGLTKLVANPGVDEGGGSVEPMPVLPDLDADTLAAIDLPAEDTPQGRLAKWKSKLLDLTLRNKLLNFKPTKATLQFVAPDVAKLEDALASGDEFKVRPLPNVMDGGADPRVAQVHVGRNGRAPLDDMALQALATKEFITRAPAEDLDDKLLAINTVARSGLEEGGANTLYLAIGFLQWTEAEKAEKRHRAPILLVPVSLQRRSVRDGFRLKRHDDEVIVNPTLLQLLSTNFQMRVNVQGLDQVPGDENGVDVERVLQSFRLAVAEIPQWEVLPEVHLGNFSFTKYLMWKDLQDRTEQLKANRVVRHLIENPGQAFEREGTAGEFDRLDDTHRPEDILAPLMLDSSQLKAICAIHAGRDLVLEGPPGTGKSQTITNIIAHALGNGKRVLFVSEKMAALSVVHRRLTDIGLAPYCLELHSSKSNKTDVLEQLGKVLHLANDRTAEDWTREAERLGTLRQDLNGVVHALHREYPNGLTVFNAIGTCISLAGIDPSPMPWADALTHSRSELDKLRETARRIQAHGREIPAVHGHPLTLIGTRDWTPTWQDDLLAAAQSLSQSADALRSKAVELSSVVTTDPAGASMGELNILDNVADLLLAAPKVPVGLARQAHDSTVREKVQTLARHGEARRKSWEQAGTGWDEQLARLNGVQLRGEWAAAKSTWWPKNYFSKRSVSARLADLRVDKKRPTPEQIDAMVAALPAVNEEDLTLRAMHEEARGLLGEAYAGVKTDWSALYKHETWAHEFSKAILKMSDGDIAKASTLRSALEPLVGEHRALLAPDAKVGRALLQFRDALREFRQRLEAVDRLAKPVAPIGGEPTAAGALTRAQGVLTGWASSKRMLQAWCLWRQVRDLAVSQGMQGLISDLEGGSVRLEDVERHFELSYRNWWVKKAIDVEPLLRSFSSADHERKIREFREADTNFQKLTERYIAAKLAGTLPRGQDAGRSPELATLLRELGKKRRQMPVRQLVRSMPTLLPTLKPCLLMSPLSVSQYLDAGYAQFDLVVFDEASQIPVWDAVGVIARGKQVVVVGDPKQLPPTNFFNKSSDGEEGGDEDQVEDLESILDECLGAGMNRLSLQWHYRSRHESLIAFSNTRYYGGDLITFPSPVTDDLAVRFERVAGVYDRGGSRTNRAEAQAIVKGIEEHYLNPAKQHLTLGVVTFNQTQQVLIETLLDERRRNSATLDRAIASRSHEPLFIKNLESVQGDERDIIFFSITYGVDAAGKMSMNFGPLNGEGGHRRLNVAISRAREGVVIYSTLMPEQIDLSRVRAAGVRDLKHYMEFAIRGVRAIAEQSAPTGLGADSPFETAVINVLRDKGWTVHPQVGCSGYRIDMAVVDPAAPGRYLVGIECDGRAYHSGATARDRDRLRQYVLENLGWKIHRIWSTDWWMNPEREVEKVVSLLNGLVEQAASDEATSEGSASAEGQHAEVDPVEPSEGTASEAGDQVEVAEPRYARAAPVPQPSSRGHSPAPRPVYAPTSLEAGDPAAFYDARSSERLKIHLQQVIDSEGPIPERIAFQRVARAWGLERTGARIVDRLRELMPGAVVQTVEPEDVFLWPGHVEPASPFAFRIAGESEASRRRTADVCKEELSAMVIHVLQETRGGIPRGDVARGVSRLLGMARTTAEAEKRIMVCVDALLAAGALSEAVDGTVARLHL
ncbi:DUF3320 domain-containing protein [Variovorax sp. Sphag1AA]|uniref:DUF3320 domain-containing protein n=1 Tax=Variovorax sp. Sphag1AA TaxID=2587027 RepID=UPI00160EB8A1|nr:DUF3320 domain-containing protein [Variovorax sp. Sphag1AA]MBB3181149.1 very-short-patch-repair endonuclease [Variovorax sp. Sphag1AA]